MPREAWKLGFLANSPRRIFCVGDRAEFVGVRENDQTKAQAHETDSGQSVLQWQYQRSEKDSVRLTCYRGHPSQAGIMNRLAEDVSGRS